MRRRFRPAMVAMALALAVGGCSSSGSDDPSTDETPGASAGASVGASASPGASEGASETAEGEAGDDSDVLPADQAATVNGEPIPNDLFEQLATAAQAQAEEAASAGATEGASIPPMDDTQVTEQRRQILSSLILSELVMQFTADKGVELTDADVQEIVDEGGEELATAAEGSGLSPEEYARLFPAQDVLINQVVDQALADVELTPEMVSGQATATLSHILVETEQEAQAALDRINGGEDFATVAAEVSTDGSAQEGGSLGEDVPLSQFVPEFGQAAAEAPLGEVVGPVQTQFGFHLIRVEDRTEPSVDDIDEDARRQALAESPAGQEAIQPVSAEFESALGDADVVVSSRYGAWDPETRTVVAEDQVGVSGSEAPGTPPAGTPPASTEPPATEAPATEAPATEAPATPTATPTE